MKKEQKTKGVNNKKLSEPCGKVCNDCLNKLMSQAIPTTSTGLVLEKKQNDMKKFIQDTCGDFGLKLNREWPKDKNEMDLVIPVLTLDNSEIEAIVHLSVCLYDKIEPLSKK